MKQPNCILLVTLQLFDNSPYPLAYPSTVRTPHFGGLQDHKAIYSTSMSVEVATCSSLTCVKCQGSGESAVERTTAACVNATAITSEF